MENQTSSYMFSDSLDTNQQALIKLGLESGQPVHYFQAGIGLALSG